MSKLISVIINVYNGEKFITKCLDSVINQSYQNLEILIINDGSTDNTLDIIKKYKDKRIKIITTKNLGLSLSRNVGIDNATGDYLYFVDADDYIELDTIGYLYHLIQKYHADIATCNPQTIFNYNFNKKEVKEDIKVLSSKDMLKKVLLSENVAGATWNKLIKKELYDNIRFEDRIINDIVVTYKLIIKTDNIIYSNQYKYFYLKHANAVTVSEHKNALRCIDFYKASIERYYKIKEIYPAFIENDIGLLRNMLRIYLVNNKKVEDYLKEAKAIDTYKEIFSIKMMFSSVSIKDKIKLLLFRINPKLYKRIGNLYRKKYKYKI